MANESSAPKYTDVNGKETSRVKNAQWNPETGYDQSSPSELKEDQVLLEEAKIVDGGKVQITIAEKIRREDQPARNNTLTQELNLGDDRFERTSGPRRHFQSGTRAGIEKKFGVSLAPLFDDSIELDTDDNGNRKMPLNVLNPTVDGTPIHIQIEETTVPDAYQRRNVQKTAKNNGRKNDPLYFIYKGAYIWSNTQLVKGKAKHKLLKITDNAGNYLPGCGMAPFGVSLDALSVKAGAVETSSHEEEHSVSAGSVKI